MWQELSPLLAAPRLGRHEIERRTVLAPDREGYRNRLRVQVLPAGHVQLFNPHKALDCVVLEPELRRLLDQVIRSSRACPQLFRGASSAELRGVDGQGLTGLRLTGPRRLDMDAVERALGSGVLVGQTGREDVPCQCFELSPGVRVDVPLDGFLQVNHAVNRRLIAAVVQEARDCGAASFVDAFMGAGNFALPLACSGLAGVGIERVPSAVWAASRSAQRHRVKGFEVFAAEVAEASRLLAERGHRTDLLVTDPPRSGLKETLALLARLRPRRWLMCSCSPRSLVPDVRRAETLGFGLRSLQVFEMFPHTAHWEVLAVLER